MTWSGSSRVWALLILVITGLNWGLYGLRSSLPAPTALPYWNQLNDQPPSTWAVVASEGKTTLWQTNLSVPLRPYRLLLSSGSELPLELIFQAQNTKPLARAHYVRLEGRGKQLRVSSGFYDAGGQARFLKEQSVQWGGRLPTLTVDIQAHSYQLGLDGQGLFKLPLRYIGGRVLLRLQGKTKGLELRALAPRETAPLLVDQPTSRSLYSADFNRPDPRWRLLAGSWRWGEGYLEQNDPQGFDLTALAPTPPLNNFRLGVRLQHLEGAGGGVVFNLPTQAGLSGGHLVRFAEDGRSLFWGYFDLKGVFVGQGFAPLEPSGLEPHQLEVLSQQSTYSVRLDGKTLARGIPLFSQSGYLGLTTSQSRTSFTELQVHRLEPEVAPTSLGFLEPGLAFAAQNGRWERVGVALYQQDPAPQEARMISQRPLELRALRLELRLAETAESVGVYGVPSPKDWWGGWGVRLSQGGRKLLWGRIGEGERLQGGSLELNGTLEPLGFEWVSGAVRLYWGSRLLGQIKTDQPLYLLLQTIQGPVGFVPLEVRR